LILYADWPVLKDRPTEFIGHKDRVGVPERFFKVILDYRDRRMIAFVIPHIRMIHCSIMILVPSAWAS
jgi:DNA/RNA endonuclease G (NUC1)